METTRVGVLMGSGPAVGVPLKQQLLFWEQFAIADLDRLLQPDVRERWSQPNSPEDIEWLREQNIVFGFPVRIDPAMASDPAYRDAFERAGEITDHVKELATKPDLGSHMRTIQLAMISRSYVCRAMAAALRAQRGVSAVSLLPVPEDRPSATASKDHVLRIVVDALPLPDDSVPFSDILQFRNEHAQQLLGLRMWASDVANGQLAGHEIQEKLEYLTGEYDEQLRLLRKAKGRGRIEIVVTTIAEVADELAHFRFGAAAKAIASIRHEVPT